MGRESYMPLAEAQVGKMAVVGLHMEMVAVGDSMAWIPYPYPYPFP